MVVKRREFLIDAGIAAIVFAASLGLLAGGGAAASDEEFRSLDGLGVALAALASLPLLARRRAPLAVFAFTAAASAALNGLGYPQGPPLGPTVALYFLAVSHDDARARSRVIAATVASLFVVHVAAVGFAQERFPTVPLLFGALVWGGAWVIGDRVRTRRVHIAELEERALRAEREAERERRLAAAEERTRIARDLHDSAGHAINVILVQAGAARLLSEKDPARARAALETIEEVARETVEDIDQLVRVLREDGGSPEPASEVEPPVGLAALDLLAERHRSAGLDVTIDVNGSHRELVPGVDQAAYRILQEALTNAARHGSGRAEVDIAFGSSALEITVTNPVRPDSVVAGGGHGIVGMRERGALLGGTLTAGIADGVFRVQARLPYAGERE
jgi:signal transduction histidine kinase